MIKKIKSDSDIFKNSKYKKDIIAFSLLEYIRKNPYLLESDEENYIIGISDPKFPVWIWTSDTINIGELKYLCKYIIEKFATDKESFRFISKKILADYLINMFEQKFKVSYSETSMQSFVNKKVIPAKNSNVIIEQALREDLTEIAICFVEFDKDCFNKETNLNEYLDYAKESIENGKIYIIKQNNKIVAMADCSKEYEDYISIAYVYTKPEFRNNGLASALTAHISKIILEKGKLPILYTDLSNPASNKAYTSIGFEEQGEVVEIELNWKR